MWDMDVFLGGEGLRGEGIYDRAWEWRDEWRSLEQLL